MFTALFWKKTWSWIKHHWYFPVIIALVIIFSVSKGDSTKKLFDLMQVRRNQYKKEIDLLNKTADEKKRKVDEALQANKSALEQIEKDHDLKIKDLKVKKRKEIDQLIKSHEEDPEELAKEIAKLLEAEHVETP